jgi:hypothetical protein
MSGPIEEWINCRCSNAPFVIPYGYMAPSFSPFREEDLVDISAEVPQVTEPTTIEPQTTESTTDMPYQLNNRENSNTNVTISQESFEKVISHKDKYQNSPFEHGNLINLKTGKLINRVDDKGTTNQVWISRPRSSENKRVGLLHNHPTEAGFSGADLKTHLGYNNQEASFATTKEGVWIARDTRYTTSQKKIGGIPKEEQDIIEHKGHAKSEEIYNKVYEQKYKDLIENAESKEEVLKLSKDYHKEYSSQYNSWLLEEFGPGKNNLIEVEFIPNERLKHVKF